MGQEIIQVNQVERVFVSRGTAIRALHQVSMSIARGTLVALMGPSGSGKTTLLNLIGGLDQPTAGEIIVEGRSLKQMSPGEHLALRRRIGFIFQSFALIPTASAYENVELGLRICGSLPRIAWDTRIRRCLAVLGLTAWMHHRPYELSGGQQQRVAIARALAIRPRIILADEPTSDLDRKTGEHILRVLRDLVDRESVTIVMSTHDPVAAAFADAVYHLIDGRIATHAVQGSIPGHSNQVHPGPGTQSV